MDLGISTTGSAFRSSFDLKTEVVDVDTRSDEGAAVFLKMALLAQLLSFGAAMALLSDWAER